MDVTELINKGKIRSFFQVRNKLIYPGAFYHIIQRATGREPLFVEVSDYQYMLRLIKDKSQKFNFRIFAFSLMPNHLHLLLQIKEANLSKGMKNLFESYADFFNDKYERKGSLFYGRYRMSLCLDEIYLLVSHLYIHVNPFRAGLVDIPESYRWSSCSLYVGLEDKKTFLDYKFILSLLDKDLSKAKEIYRKLLRKAMDIKMEDVLERPSAIESFWRKTSKLISRIVKREDVILSSPLQEAEIMIEELKKKKSLRRPQELEAKRFLLEQLISRGYQVSEIAERIGQTRQSIYHLLNLTKQARLKL